MPFPDLPVIRRPFVQERVDAFVDLRGAVVDAEPVAGVAYGHVPAQFAPEVELFRIVFGTMQRLADMSVVPPSPPPFALSSEDAMREALEAVGFGGVSCVRLPLVFRAPKGQFAEHFRNFAARAAVILDKQTDEVLTEIYATWDSQLEEFLVGGEYHVRRSWSVGGNGMSDRRWGGSRRTNVDGLLPRSDHWCSTGLTTTNPRD